MDSVGIMRPDGLKLTLNKAGLASAGNTDETLTELPSRPGDRRMPHSISSSPIVLIHHTARRGPIPRDVRACVWNMTMGQCWYCGSHTNPFVDFCVDHVRPLARGGADEIENLVPCCQHCNSTKAAKLLHEWRENFSIAHILDEEPWIDQSGLFFFERSDFWPHRRSQEIKSYRRAQEGWSK